MLQRLINIGFKKAGYWSLDNEQLKLVYSLPFKDKNALYAFAMGEEVKYVGKTSNFIHKRLKHYERPDPSQKTNQKINNILKALLKKNKIIEVYIFVDHEPEKVGEFTLNLAAGLEDSIISILNPEWNYNGRNKTKKFAKKKD